MRSHKHPYKHRDSFVRNLDGSQNGNNMFEVEDYTRYLMQRFKSSLGPVHVFVVRKRVFPSRPMTLLERTDLVNLEARRVGRVRLTQG